MKYGTLALFENKNLIISEIKTGSGMQDLWIRYKKKYDYANAISWGDVMSSVEAALDDMMG